MLQSSGLSLHWPCATSDPSLMNTQSCTRSYKVVKKKKKPWKECQPMEDGNQWKHFPDPHCSPCDRLKKATYSLLLPAAKGREKQQSCPCPWILAGPVTHSDEIPWDHRAVREPKLVTCRERGPMEEHQGTGHINEDTLNFPGIPDTSWKQPSEWAQLITCRAELPSRALT